MAVYTHISEDELRDFLSHYALPPLERFEGIAQGVENTNYRIFMADGSKYILTLYEARVDPADLPFFFAFTNHLAGQGIEAPAALAGQDGELVRNVAGKPAALIACLDGEDIKEDSITPDHCREIGHVLARMHQAARSFDGARENALGLSGWKALAGSVQGRADEVEPGLARLIADEIAFLDAHWPKDNALPRGVIHADLFPDNVFFRDEKISGVIDFYFSCDDFLAYDLALVVNAWCFDGLDFSAERWAALQQGYALAREFQRAEGEALSVLCRAAALRILLTRLYAWLNHQQDALVQPKDPKEYSAKLKWHQNEKIGC